jgi:hypothetical protein
MKSAKEWVNTSVVGNVIASIFLGGSVEGAQPDCVNAKLLELG